MSKLKGPKGIETERQLRARAEAQNLAQEVEERLEALTPGEHHLTWQRGLQPSLPALWEAEDLLEEAGWVQARLRWMHDRRGDGPGMVVLVTVPEVPQEVAAQRDEEGEVEESRRWWLVFGLALTLVLLLTWALQMGAG